MRSGIVRLGDRDARPETGGGLETTAGNIAFHNGSALVADGGLSLVILPERRACLTFFPGSVLDVGKRPLGVATGRLILHGTLRIGGIEDDDPFLLNYVSVDQGTGRAAIGAGFKVELTDSYLDACRKSPEDAVPGSTIIDAVVTRITGEGDRYWEQIIETRAGRFRASARLGAEPDRKGGLRLSYLG